MKKVWNNQKRHTTWNHFYFTPTLTGTGGSFSSITYTIQSGSVMICGTHLYYNLEISWNAASGGSGDLVVNISDLANHDPSYNALSSLDFSSTEYITENLAINSRPQFFNTLHGASSGNMLRSSTGANFLFQQIPVSVANSGTFTKKIQCSSRHQADKYFGEVEP